MCLPICVSCFFCFAISEMQVFTFHSAADYITLSHLINHSIELNATQPKPAGSESEVICLFRSSPTFLHPFSPHFKVLCDSCVWAGSFFMVHIFLSTHCLIGFTEGPSLLPQACPCAIRSSIKSRAPHLVVKEKACKSDAAEGCISSHERWMD